ncbi:MAG: patatin-like phospholipase family protein, partial [Mesorhizobium sp.]
IDTLMAETVEIKDQLKREVERVLEGRAAVKGKRGKKAG